MLAGGSFMIEFLISWGPTFLFLLIILNGFIWGLIRGFRKTTILFIHMLIVGMICLIVFLAFLNGKNFDQNITSMTNSILNHFGKNWIEILKLDENTLSTGKEILGIEGAPTLQETLAIYIANLNSDNPLAFYLILEDSPYIFAIVEMILRMAIGIIIYIFYFLFIFLFYIIYLIFYPVRRKIKRVEKEFQRGERPTPYKKKRFLGGCMGMVRAFVAGIIAFSFLGALIYIVTGNQELKSRYELQSDENELKFNSEEMNKGYDYYSYICKMGNTGIFKILNNIKDPSSTPYYFYFADLVLQGSFEDDKLGIKDKFYLRDELGYYVQYTKEAFNLFLKYADKDYIENLDFSKIDQDEFIKQIEVLFSMPEFVEAYEALIDQFEDKPFFIHLALSTITSLVNHMDLITDDELILDLIQTLFLEEDSIKVTDLATKDDVKFLFKSVVNVVAIASEDPMKVNEDETTEPTLEQKKKDTQKIILYAKAATKSIQEISIFKDSSRSTIGNKLFSGLYKFAIQYMEKSSTDEENKIDFSDLNLDDIIWVDEFNLLFKACDPAFDLAYHIYDPDQNVLVKNIFGMFAGEQASKNEQAYTLFTEQIVESQILGHVLQSNMISKMLDDVVFSITQNEEAKLPKNIQYMGEKGELAIFLDSFKDLLKKCGNDIYVLIENQKDIQATQLISLAKSMNQPIEENGSIRLVDKVLDSQLVHYLLSTILLYMDFNEFEIYSPKESLETIENYKILKIDEIKLIVNFIVQCEDVIINMIDDPENFDYINLVSNNYLLNLLDQSFLIQGTISNYMIKMAKEEKSIILPIAYAVPDAWLAQNGKPGEISILVKAIKELKDAKDKDGNPLINAILNNTIEAETILNLENEIIYTMMESKVLQYTISGQLDLFAEQGFKLVVPRISLEEIDAETTVDGVTVNVICSDDLAEMVVLLKKFIEFDSEGNIKILYGEIFKNKAELVSNYIISASLMGNFMDMSNTADTYFVMPSSYATAYTSFTATCETKQDLIGNIWFGKVDIVEDDELYYLLDAIESIVCDENGQLPDDFDVETSLNTSIVIPKKSTHKISQSAILRASLSKQILNVKEIQVSEDLYEDSAILSSEFMILFNVVYDLLEVEEIAVNTISTKFETLNLTKSKINAALESDIMSNTLSQYILDVEQVQVPLNTTSEIQVIRVDEQQQVFKASRKAITKTEITHFFDSFFELLEVDEQEGLSIHNMSQKLEGLVIKKSTIETILSEQNISIIVKATLSQKILDIEELSVPDDKTEAYTLSSGIPGKDIDRLEMLAFFTSIFILLEKTEISTATIGDEMNQLSLKKTTISHVLDSEILHMTLSQKLLEVEELNIPMTQLNSVMVKEKNQYNIHTIEILNFFNAIFALVGTDTIHINTISDELAEIEIDASMLEELLLSKIMTSTLSKNILESGAITVDDIVKETIEVFDHQATIRTMDIIEQLELNNFLNAILLFSNGKINAKNLTLDQILLPSTKEDIGTMLNSIILCTTLSKTIRESETSILVLLDQEYTPYTYQSKTSTEMYINSLELGNLVYALTAGMHIQNANDLTIETITVPKQNSEIEAVKDSRILRTSISKIILEQEAAAISLADTDAIDINYSLNQVSVGVLTAKEIQSIIYGVNCLGLENFDNIEDGLDIITIIESDNKEEIISILANSSLYRTVLSKTLNDNFTANIKVYQILCSSSATANIIVDGVSQIYNYRLSTLGIPMSNPMYEINYPTFPVNAYTSFTLATGSRLICSKADIIALGYVTSRNFSSF